MGVGGSQGQGASETALGAGQGSRQDNQEQAGPLQGGALAQDLKGLAEGVFGVQLQGPHLQGHREQPAWPGLLLPGFLEFRHDDRDDVFHQAVFVQVLGSFSVN